MQVETQIKIKNNPHLYRYLRENSTWYKYLNRNDEMITILEEEVKEKYKLRPIDKIENISKTISLVESFLDIIK